MNFAEPIWLAASAAVMGAIVGLGWLDARRRRVAVERFASPALADALTSAVARRRRVLKLALVALGAAALFVALARPRWGWRWEESQRQGTDILFAVDTSKSMLAEDVRPNRLARAKLAIAELVEQFEGDRAGLVAFAGNAFLQAPMTLDRDAFQRALDELDTRIIPRGGTNVAAAIREAVEAFGDSAHEKVLVLVSDGESLEGDALESARAAAERGVRIFTIGIGSNDGGPVPVPDERGGTTLLRDPTTGELVRSALDEGALREIAEVTGGAYVRLGSDGHGLVQLWRDHLSGLPSHAVATRRQRVFTERFQWPLGIALALLLLEPLVGERRRRARVAPRAARQAAGALAALALAAWMPVRAYAQTSRDEERARRELEAAARAEGRAAVEQFNVGARALEAGEHEAAIEAMDRAIAHGDLGVQQSAYYDRGNAQYRAGEAQLERDRELTKGAWREAIESYEGALALQPDDADARYNLELVRRRLALLEQQEQADQPQSGSESQGQPQSGGESQGQPQSGSESQGQPQSGSESQGQPQSGGESQGQPQSGGESQGQPQSGGESQGQPQGGGESQGQPQSGGERQDESQRGGESRGEASDGAQSGDEHEARPQGGAAEQPTHADDPGDPQPDGEARAGNDEGERGDDPAHVGGTERAARLSRDEAVQLLRSLRGHERRLPLSGTTAEASDEGPRKDW